MRGNYYLQFLPIFCKNQPSRIETRIQGGSKKLQEGFAFWHCFCDNTNGSSQKLIRRIPMEIIRRFVREEEGQGLVEYALIIALIAIVAIAGLTLAGTKVSGMFTSISGKLTTT